ncbi:PaaX family transcriptional regulator C-terminal domain-containing protein [Shimia thalassica]|nr:PaaX family transcriptional regulator C-terminal domain-containing protein [Shimia thalassica]
MARHPARGFEPRAGMVITVSGFYNEVMEDAEKNWFQHAISVLTYNRNQRVWSVIVTLFGDLVQGHGDKISGSALSAIIEPMGIKPEALRVALFRLRNDGWLASEKAGRSSFYFLTEHGLRESEAATPRIYARTPTPISEWRLVVQDVVRMAARQSAEKEMRHAGCLVVAPGVFLAPVDGTQPDIDGFVMTGRADTIPEWLRARTSPPELVSAYQDLEAALDAFCDLMKSAPALSPAQVATLRTVIVHNWRKALLSHPELPEAFFTKEWRGEACRRKVMQTLDRLGRPTLDTLNPR